MSVSMVQKEHFFESLFPDSRKTDCITVGRANVDFYPVRGERLDQARSYETFVGGSPANIAAGLARLGLSVAILTRVADDQLGNFVVNYLEKIFGIDCSVIQRDRTGAKTALAFAERRPDANTIMYRNNPADILLDPTKIDPEIIKRSRSVCITGTALTASPSRNAVMKVLQAAQEAGTACIMDIDYRPYGWDSLSEAATVLCTAAELCDIVIGTEEEFAIASKYLRFHDEAAATEKLIEQLVSEKSKIVLVKRGSKGSQAYLQNGEIIEGYVFPVAPVKPWGAGDAYASAFIAYLMQGNSVEKSLKAAAAAASINITGDSCTEAMPYKKDIEEFILKQQNKE